MAHRENLTVILASRVYEPEGTAAAYRLGSLVRALERRGHTSIVMTSRAPNDKSSTPSVRRWPVLRDSSGSVRGYLPYLSFDIPLFFRLLFGPRADIVVVEPPPTTGVAARIACWLRRTPYVYFSADVLSAAVKGIGANRFVVAAVTWLEKRSVRGAVGVLATSNDVKHKVVELGAKPDNVEVIGTGIDTDQFSTQGDRVDIGVPYFVYAGTMSEVHGAGAFLDAFEKVVQHDDRVELRVFASGVELESLKARTQHLGSRIVFSGVVDAAELAPWIRGATATLASVRPGRGYDFAFATKALASLACGTPVIYAGVGPLGQLISQNELGWSTTWDPITIADAMSLALRSGNSDPDTRLSRWVTKHHSLRTVADRAARVVENWATKSGSTGAFR